jgi:hypothetical protein
MKGTSKIKVIMRYSVEYNDISISKRQIS